MTSPRRHNNSSQGRNRSREADATTPVPPSQPPAIQERQAPQTVERIGDILRRTREKRGDELHHIAEYLCIRRSFLAALEDSQYEKFPADAYVIGFLRSYAELLGLDGKEAINMYRAEMAGRRKKPVLSMPTPMPEGRSPSVFILIGAVVTAILVYVLWYGLSSSDRATVSAAPPLPVAPITSAAEPTTNVASSVPPVPIVPVSPPAIAPQTTASATAVTTAPTDAAALKAPAQDQAASGGKPAHLIIRADQSSWIMVTDSRGTTVIDRVLKPGETYKVPDGPGLVLTTGNAAGLTLTLDGADLPKLSSAPSGSSNGILRGIPLDTNRLKAATQAH